MEKNLLDPHGDLAEFITNDGETFLLVITGIGGGRPFIIDGGYNSDSITTITEDIPLSQSPIPLLLINEIDRVIDDIPIGAAVLMGTDMAIIDEGGVRVLRTIQEFILDNTIKVIPVVKSSDMELLSQDSLAEYIERCDSALHIYAREGAQDTISAMEKCVAIAKDIKRDGNLGDLMLLRSYRRNVEGLMKTLTELNGDP